MSSNRTNSPPASPDDNLALAGHAAAIHHLGRQAVKNVIEIGRRLTECKEIVRKLGGSWGDWLEHEFNWSDQQARRFIHVFEHKSELNKLLNSDFPVSALYLLAAPSTPKEARTEVIERAQAGETVPVAEVKRTIERTKGRKLASSKRKPTTKPPTRTKSKHDAANDIGATSAFEIEWRDARIEELENAKRRLEIKITGLESEIEELRAKLTTGTGGDMSISEFQTAIKKWEETVETQRGIIARLENENANLRAQVAAPPDDALDIPASLRRAPR
jgi:hypothetical protein